MTSTHPTPQADVKPCGAGDGAEINAKRARGPLSGCLECRNKRIRCAFSKDDPKRCLNCHARGAECTQKNQNELPTKFTLTHRVARLEKVMEYMLQEKLMPDNPSRGDESPECPEIGIKDPNCQNPATIRLASVPSHQQPLADHRTQVGDLFPVFRHESFPHSDSMPVGSRNAVTIFNIFGHDASSLPQSLNIPSGFGIRHEQARMALFSLFPSKAAMLSYFGGNVHWWRHRPILSMGTQTGEGLLQHLHTKGTAFDVANILTHTASEINQRNLERIPSSVNHLIINDDTFMRTLEGLKTSVLLIRFYMDLGEIHRANVVLRRTICFAQLANLHKIRHPIGPEEHVWTLLYFMDRGFCLLYGFSYSIPDGSTQFARQAVAKSPGDYTVFDFMVEVVEIASLPIELARSAEIPDLMSILDTDRKLTNLTIKLPAEFWDDSQVQVSDGRILWSQNFAKLAYFQVKVMLHLTFYLRPPRVPGFDLSVTHMACVDNARQVLMRYLKYRDPSDLIPSRDIDYTGFISCIVIVIYLYNAQCASHHPDELSADWLLVETALQSFHTASQQPSARIPSQCYKGLDRILRFRGHRAGESIGRTITIPFLGAITIPALHIPQPNGRIETHYGAVPRTSIGEDPSFGGMPQGNVFPGADIMDQIPVANALPLSLQTEGLGQFVDQQQGPILLQSPYADMGGTPDSVSTTWITSSGTHPNQGLAWSSNNFQQGLG